MLPDRRTRWALVVGVSSYIYAPPAAQLRYAHRDAEEFAKLLRSTSGGGVPASNLRLLANEGATLASIRAALHNWLPKVAGAEDIVYVFFAGHAISTDKQESYFVAHDSDPQNLSATALPFPEVNDALVRKLRAAQVVLFADACHAGGIGWTSDPKSLSRAHGPLEALGSQDRSIMKLLASKPSERSYEDERWGGGHGVFTYSLLNGLRGAADRERDGLIRAGELIEYVSRIVPEQTSTQQTPRVAGNFEGNLPLAMLHAATPPVAAPSTLRVLASPGATVYVDSQFRGAVRPTGELIVDRLAPGTHVIFVDVPGLPNIEQRLNLPSGQTTFEPEKLAEFKIVKLQSLANQGKLDGTGGVLEMYKSLSPDEQRLAEPVVAAALEQVAQQCVSDYVQSTTNALKGPLFLRAAGAFRQLRAFRPQDASLEAKAAFCQARAEIAEGDFKAAIDELRKSLSIDPKFACSYNALGVALTRLNQPAEARKAFEKARELEPEWALPSLDIARQYLATGDIKGAVPHLEQAARLFPNSAGIRWSLARAYRVLGRGDNFLREAKAVTAIDPNYAPIYSELGLHYESVRNYAEAARAFETYLLLAPNYADSAEMRARAAKNRSAAAPRPETPSLRRPGERK